MIIKKVILNTVLSAFLVCLMINLSTQFWKVNNSVIQLSEEIEEIKEDIKPLTWEWRDTVYQVSSNVLFECTSMFVEKRFTNQIDYFEIPSPPPEFV